MSLRMGARRERDRIEQESARRRARAHHHLDRVRNRHANPQPAAPRPVWLAGALAVALVCGIWIGDDALAGLGDSGWRVSDVEVQGARRLTPIEVARAAGIAVGDAYSTADPDRIARALLENAWVAEAHAARLPGGTVVLRIREREPLAVIEARGGPLGVDVEGRPFAVLEPREAEDLPRLRCESAPPPGGADERLAEAIRVARSLPERGLALPREIAVGSESDPEGLVLRLPGMETRFVLGAEDYDARVEVMAELLEKRPADVAAAEQVDLRFAGQAVLQSKADDKKSSA
jgi:cell division protein FtsQ